MIMKLFCVLCVVRVCVFLFLKPPCYRVLNLIRVKGKNQIHKRQTKSTEVIRVEKKDDRKRKLGGGLKALIHHIG